MGKHIVPAVFVDWALAGGSVPAATMRAVNCGSSIVGAIILGIRRCTARVFSWLPLLALQHCEFGSGK